MNRKIFISMLINYKVKKESSLLNKQDSYFQHCYKLKIKELI